MDTSSTPDGVLSPPPQPRRKLSAIGVAAHVVVVPHKDEAMEGREFVAPPAAANEIELVEAAVSAKKRPRPTLSLQRMGPDDHEPAILYEDSSIIISQTATPDTPYLDDPLYGRFYLGHGKFAFWPTVWFIFSPFYPGSLVNWNEGSLCGRAMQLPSVNRDKATLLARQLCSFSTAMVIAQAALVGVMCNVVTVPLSLNNMWGPSGVTLRAFGACNGEDIVHHGQWTRLFVPLFQHAGVIEAVVLGLLLLRLGALLEFRWGTLNCVLAYVITGVHGLTTGAAQYPKAVKVGGYVALAGLLGVWISEQAGIFLMGRSEMSRPQRSIELGMCLASMLIVLLFALLGSFHDASAPASAFLAGILYAMAALWTLPEHDPRPRTQFLIRGLASLCLFGVCTYSLVYLYLYAPIPTAPRRKLHTAHA